MFISEETSADDGAMKTTMQPLSVKLVLSPLTYTAPHDARSSYIVSKLSL